ncbi:MAG: SDR family NAD(P)-dependent oxidoreductase [Sphingobacteriaceae bacterium]|nr:MAG: SDR family NAD(P)-dependent oxidoreductase [Sphingobacteriaceae bacterium]
MCRKQEQLQQFSALGLEAVLADFNDSESLTKGMQGCEQLFLLTSPDQDHTLREKKMIDLAIEAGIKHIVRLSTSDTNLSTKLPYGKSHAEIDHYLQRKPVNWTILRPTGFMQNFIESRHPIGNGALPHCLNDGQISYIDLRDIASVAKTVLTEDKHNEATYYLTGPESLTMNEVAAELTNGLEHEIRSANKTEEEMRKILTYAHLTDWYIDALIEQFRIGGSGGEIATTKEVQRLTGKAARTFSQFVQDYKADFLKI